MDLLFPTTTQLWNALVPTTWFLLLGPLLSANLLRTTLFQATLYKSSCWRSNNILGINFRWRGRCQKLL